MSPVAIRYQRPTIRLEVVLVAVNVRIAVLVQLGRTRRPCGERSVEQRVRKWNGGREGEKGRP